MHRFIKSRVSPPDVFDLENADPGAMPDEYQNELEFLEDVFEGTHTDNYVRYRMPPTELRKVASAAPQVPKPDPIHPPQTWFCMLPTDDSQSLLTHVSHSLQW